MARLVEEGEQRAAAARWEELKRAAVIAGTVLVEDPQPSSRDYNEEVARFLALHNSNKVEAENAELVKAWAHIQADADRGLLILERRGEIDKEKPSGYEILAKFVPDDDKSNLEFWAKLSDRVGKEVDKSALEGQFRDAEARLNGSIGSLREIANGLSHKELPNAISAQYLPSWEGTHWGDSLEVQNISNGPLENAVVIVTAHMNDGSAHVHVHYVDDWQSGTWLKALYPYRATDYANAQTGSPSLRLRLFG